MRFDRWAMVAFFIVMAGVSLWVNIQKPRLLILHSYSTDYIWTQEVNEGFDRVLADVVGVTVRYHYMKTKRFSDKDSLRRAGIAAQEAIEREKPDVVLAVDDYAQKLAASRFVDHPDIKIVFAGINGGIEPYGYDQANNVTGILERKPVVALREILLTLADHRPGETAPRAVYLADLAYSSRRDAEYLARFDWAPLRYLPVLQAADFEDWKRKVMALADKTDILLVSGYRKLPRSASDSAFSDPGEVAAWTEANSPVPVVGLNIFNSADGIMLSVGVSPYEQAEVSANMALDIIQGRREIADVPITTSRQYVVGMSRAALERRGFKMPGYLEAFARATDNYYP